MARAQEASAAVTGALQLVAESRRDRYREIFQHMSVPLAGRPRSHRPAVRSVLQHTVSSRCLTDERAALVLVLVVDVTGSGD
jgi:hypothetical protein